MAKQEANKLFLQKFEQALENKNWNNLNQFEREVLYDCLEMEFGQLKRKYGGQLGKLNFIKLIRALEKIYEQNLINLIRNNDNNFITYYQYLSKLKEFKEEIKVPKTNTPSSVKIDRESDELKFKLTINENQYHPDSPLHAGTVTFKKRIVIESGVEYIFGLWNRANDNLYLTMTPLENLEKQPKLKELASSPFHYVKELLIF